MGGLRASGCYGHWRKIHSCAALGDFEARAAKVGIVALGAARTEATGLVGVVAGFEGRELAVTSNDPDVDPPGDHHCESGAVGTAKPLNQAEQRCQVLDSLKVQVFDDRRSEVVSGKAGDRGRNRIDRACGELRSEESVKATLVASLRGTTGTRFSVSAAHYWYSRQ